MPAIPRYQSQVGLSGGTPLPKASGAGGRALYAAERRIGAEQENLGKSAMNAALTVQEIARKDDERSQRDTVQKELNAMRAKDRVKMAELLDRKGEAAKGIYKEWDEYVAESEREYVGDENKSEYQRELFRTSSRAIRGPNFDRTLTHQRNELFKSEINSLDSKMYNDKEDAVAARNDPARTIGGRQVPAWTIEYESRQLSLEQKAARLGWTDEQKEAQQTVSDTEFFSAMAQGYIKDMVAEGYVNDEQTDKPKKFIEEQFASGRLTSKARTVLLAQWEVGAVQQKAYGKTQEILTETKGKTYSERVEMANDIQDPKIRSRVKKNLKDINTEQERVRKEFFAGKHSNAQLRIQASTSAAEAKAIVDQYARTFGGQYSQGGSDTRQLEAYYKSKFGITNSATARRDRTNEIAVKDQIDSGELDTELKIVTALAGKTNDVGTNEVLSYFKSGGRMAPTGAKQLVPLLKRVGYGSLITRRVKGGRKGQMEIDKEALGSISSYLQEQFADTKGIITSKMITDEVDELAAKGFIEKPYVPRLFEENVTLLDAIKTGRTDAWVPEVPKEEKNRIAAILKSRGVRVTDDRIIQYVKQVTYGLKPGIGVGTGVANR